MFTVFQNGRVLGRLPRGFAAAFLFFAAAYPVYSQASENGSPRAGAVPSLVCAECHSAEYDAWKDSDHGWALREPSAENVLGDFNDAEFVLDGETNRFTTQDGRYFIEALGPDGQPTIYEVKYTVGVRPLQQYLLETEPGKLQSFDVAWDTEQKRWFHLYPNAGLKPGDGLHWTGPYKNWNGRCAECHQTDFVKGYDPLEASYHSEWSDLTIGCGACHGTGADHVAWAENPDNYAETAPTLALTKGFDITLPRATNQENIEICAGCHARRSTVSPNSPEAGTSFDDNYRLALLRNGLYHADGQIDDEVYVYGSFLQSKMYAKGVTCLNCHDPHSGELVGEGNTTCLQCHSPAGNPDFVSLPKKDYDDPSHHHHEPGSEGALCVNCHMPSKNFMQVDPRRDHSFRIPRPDLTIEIGSPNACGSCHEAEGPEWAVAALEEWFPGGHTGRFHYGLTLSRGRGEQSAADNAALADLALDETQADIVRATAVTTALPGLTRPSFDRMLPLLADDSALVRAAALQLLEQVPADLRLSAASALLGDPAETVRLAAARLLIGQPSGTLDDATRQQLSDAVQTFQQSLIGHADFPETQLQIGGLGLMMRDFDAAVAGFETAATMDPQMEQAWIMVSRIQRAQGQTDAADVTLTRAANAIPDSAEIQFQLGQLAMETQDFARAVEAFEIGMSLSGPSPEILDLLVNAAFQAGDVYKAVDFARQIATDYPDYRPSELALRVLTLRELDRSRE